MTTSDRLTPERESHFRDWAASHTAVHSGELLAEIDALRRDLASAESRGFERAREMAVRVAMKHCFCQPDYRDPECNAHEVADAIRSMKDETP